MGFASDIRAFVDKAEKSMSDNTNKIVTDLFTKAVVLSPSPVNPGPYAKGLLINQWYFSVGVPSSEIGTTTSDNGSDSITRIQDIVTLNPFLGKDSTVYLSNNTEEAYYADVLGWAQGQGTNGWIWTGKQGPYRMRAQAIQYILGAYT